jgi:uncharacterized protein YdhG (YjbR/CyaY superfamily)
MAAFKSHCSFFPMSLAVVKAYRRELAPFDAAKGTIHFTTDRPLPAALVRKLVEARMAENEKRASAKRLNFTVRTRRATPTSSS